LQFDFSPGIRLSVICLTALLLSPASFADALNWLPGTWEVDLKAMAQSESPAHVEEEKAYQCSGNPYKIELRDGGKKMFYTNVTPVAEKYSDADFIIDHGDNYVALQCDRDRADADCNEWDWYIVFNGPNEHFWVREDWIDAAGKITGTTISRFRCEGPVA